MPITISNTFTPATAILSAEVNENFQNIVAQALAKTGDTMTGALVVPTVTISGAGATALDIAGGINAGSGNVGIVGTDGRIPALSTTYVASLSGADLTTLNATSLSSGTVANARLTPIIPPTVVVLTDGATPALDAALGNVFELTALGNRTIAVPTNPTNGQKIIIKHIASGGARTLALNTGVGGFRFGTDVTALTATTSGLTDYIGCIYNATATKWDVVAYAKGY